MALPKAEPEWPYWPVRMMRIAWEASTWSKDPQKQIGCVAVNDRRRILATGYNGFPSKIADTLERLNDRVEKHKYMLHAEENLIFNAASEGVSLSNSTVYVYGLPVCDKCALKLVQSGVENVIMCFPNNIRDYWAEAWTLTQSIFDEAQIHWARMPRMALLESLRSDLILLEESIEVGELSTDFGVGLTLSA